MKLGKSQECQTEAEPDGQYYYVLLTCQMCFQKHTGVVSLALVRRLWLSTVGCEGKWFESCIQKMCGKYLHIA